MRIVIHGRSTGFLTAFALLLYKNNTDNHDYSKIDDEVLSLLPRLSKPQGTLISMGKDSEGNELCLLGRGKEKKVVIQSLLGFSRIFSSQTKMVFFDLAPYENSLLFLGDFFLKKNLDLGKKIAKIGIRNVHNRLKDDLIIFYRNINR